MAPEGQDIVTPNVGPTSWRDVYQLVQDSEKRLTVTINDGFARQSAISTDHEVRIRVLEKTDQKQAGGFAVITAGRAMVVAGVSIVTAVVAVLGLVNR